MKDADPVLLNLFMRDNEKVQHLLKLFSDNQLHKTGIKHETWIDQ